MHIFFQKLVPQHILTSLVGAIAKSELQPLSKWLVHWFAKKYKLNLSEAKQKDLNEYKTLSSLFTREVDLNLRPLDSDASLICSSADSKVSQFGTITSGRVIQAKGSSYSVSELLQTEQFSNTFNNGEFITQYLAPKDYHRVHMPIRGKLIGTTFIPGKLFSVNDYTAANLPNLFTQNERLCCFFETNIGIVAQVLVGAMIVGSIETTWGKLEHLKLPKKFCSPNQDGITIEKGAEMGLFNFGSTVITIFEPNKVLWKPELKVGDTLQVRQTIASIKH